MLLHFPLPRLAQGFAMPKRSAISLMLLLLCLASPFSVGHATDLESILQRMEASYATVTDYQSRVEVTSAEQDGTLTTEKFLYTFKRPKQVRIDFERPHAGMVVIYTNKDGKVRVRPWGVGGILELDLDPDSVLLRLRSGQRVDQTDLGLLIAEIRESVGEHRRGPVELSENEDSVEISVLADNHFREGVTTRYRFLINKPAWLPRQVQEFSPGGQLERRILFLDLRTNIGVPDSAFE